MSRQKNCSMSPAGLATCSTCLFTRRKMHINVSKKLHHIELVYNEPAEELQHVTCRTGHVLHLPVQGTEKCIFQGTVSRKQSWSTVTRQKNCSMSPAGLATCYTCLFTRRKMHINVSKKLHQIELVHNEPAEELQHVTCRTGHVFNLPVHGTEKCI